MSNVNEILKRTREDGRFTMAMSDAKERLHELILTEVIGEDGILVSKTINDNSIRMTGRDINANIEIENALKHRERQTLAKLFNKEQ